MRSTSAFHALTFGFWLAMPAVRAQSPAAPPNLGSRSAYRISLDQLSGLVELHTPDGRLVDSWSRESRGDRAPLAQIPAGHAVDLEVINANPLLYRYDVQVVSVGRKPLPACGTLGSRLVSSGLMASLAAGAMAAQPLLAQTLPQLVQPPAPEAGTRGGAAVTAAALEAAYAEHGQSVARYADFLEAVRVLSVSLGDSLEVLAELGESLPMDSLLTALEQSLNRAAPGLSQTARVPRTVREQQTLAGLHVAALAPYAAAVRGGNFEGDAASVTAAETVRLLARVEQGEQNLSAAYRALQSQLLRIETAKARTRQVFSVEASGDIRRLTLELLAQPDYPKVFRAKIGRQEVFAEPFVSLLCEVSLGVGFMNRPPNYALANGVLADTRESGQRSGVAVMLHLALARVPWVGPLLGFGFGSGGVPDLYAGGSLRVLNPLMINFGTVWQQSDHLPSDLKLGQPVADPSRLQNLPRRYVPAFFWGVSFAR